jgi:hypothetical protein
LKFNNIAIGKRLGITFGAVALITAAMAAGSYWSLVKVGDRWLTFRSVSLEKSAAVNDGEVGLGDAISTRSPPQSPGSRPPAPRCRLRSTR